MVCLKEDEVIAIVTGLMAGDALAVAEAHIDTCRACRLLLSTLATRTGELGHAGHSAPSPRATSSPSATGCSG